MPEGLKVTVQQYLKDIKFFQLQQLLLKINASQSPGPDHVHLRRLKECANVFLGPLFMLFRAPLSAGKLPQAWKEGSITPIFKKVSHLDASNYRREPDISLL